MCKAVEFDFDKVLNEQVELRKNVNEVHQKLIKELSKIDSEINDVEHYIEKYDLNASDGFKAYKLLQEKMQYRRKIKDGLAKSNILYGQSLSSLKGKNFDNINNPKYKPRILLELFKGRDGVLK